MKINKNPDATRRNINERAREHAISEYNRKIRGCDEAINKNPEDPSVWKNKGIVFDDFREYKKAIECYNEAIKRSPEDSSAWELWELKGLAIYALGMHNEAREVLKKSRELKEAFKKDKKEGTIARGRQTKLPID